MMKMVMIMKQIITTKNGTTYEREVKDKKYSTKVTIRFAEDTIEDLKEIALKEETKYNTIIRNLAEKFVEDYKNGKRY